MNQKRKNKKDRKKNKMMEPQKMKVLLKVNQAQYQLAILNYLKSDQNSFLKQIKKILQEQAFSALYPFQIN